MSTDQHIEEAAGALVGHVISQPGSGWQWGTRTNPLEVTRLAVSAWLKSVGITSHMLAELARIADLTDYVDAELILKHWLKAVEAVQP